MNLLENRELLRGLLKQTDYMNTVNGGIAMTSVKVGKTDSKYEIKVNAPSVGAECFNILLDYNKLTVYSFLPQADSEEGMSDLFKIPTFIKTFDIPPFVDPDGIEALAEDGKIKIILPFKSSPDNAQRMIYIKNIY